MTDWRDVMDARTTADQVLGRLEEFEGGTASAVVYGLLAVCLELRALGVALDYTVSGGRSM